MTLYFLYVLCFLYQLVCYISHGWLFVVFANRILVLGKLNGLVKEWIKEISDLKVKHLCVSVRPSIRR